MPVERSWNNLKRKAPKTATIILPPTVDSLSDVKINEPKYIININIEMGKKISLSNALSKSDLNKISLSILLSLNKFL